MSERSQAEQTNQPASLLRDRAGIVATAWPPVIAIARDCIKDATAGLVASVAAATGDRHRFAHGRRARFAQRVGRFYHLGERWQSSNCSSNRDADVHNRDLYDGYFTLRSRCFPLGIILSVCAIFCGWWIPWCYWLVSYLRRPRDDSSRPQDLNTLLATWTSAQTARLISGIGVLLVLLSLRRWVKSPFALPAALLTIWASGMFALQALGLSDPEQGWYFPSLGTLSRWSPFEAAHSVQLNWSMRAGLVPGVLAVTIVALISLVTKVSSIEVLRQASGDLNRELRGHGIASLVAAPFGGMTSGLQVSTSRLLEHAGGATRMSGVACALALGSVGIANFNLPGLIPIPIVAGLVFYLGCSFLIEAFWRPYFQRAWLDLLLAIGIMIVCIEYGYLIGVLIGLIAACLLFAISYARFGVVRRHATRAEFASHVDRSLEASEHLRAAGDGIKIYWLSGYIFFGSSEGIFERIQSDIEALPRGRVVYIVIDFGRVSGADSSAIVSLTKLRNFCDQRGTTLVYCSLSPTCSPQARRVFRRQKAAPGIRKSQPRAGLVRGPTACQGEPRYWHESN